jgi:hypothetical protein
VFDLAIGTMVLFFFIALGIGPVLLFVLRIIAVIHKRIKIWDALIIIFTPFSLGYFYLMPAQGKIKTLYRTLALTSIILMIIASFFIFYMQR